jgi:hypothetical protein
LRQRLLLRQQLLLLRPRPNLRSPSNHRS